MPQAASLGITLPPLCSCGASHALDPAYTSKCCANCRLRGRPDLHEALLNMLLRNADLLV